MGAGTASRRGLIRDEMPTRFRRALSRIAGALLHCDLALVQQFVEHVVTQFVNSGPVSGDSERQKSSHPRRSSRGSEDPTFRDAFVVINREDVLHRIVRGPPKATAHPADKTAT